MHVYHYLKHLVSSVNERKVDVPFIRDLLSNAVYVKHDYYSYKKIEQLRERLLDSNETITYTDFGAGATAGGKTTKKVKTLAKDVAKGPKHAQLLFRLVNYFQPAELLELGTSLGISTAYMASANSRTKVTTIEGSGELSELAKKHFKALKLKNIEHINGTFEEVLKKVLNEKSTSLDFVFFDGNHRKKATLNYFECCMQKAHENSVFVVDDIHWSEEMQQAWEEIKANTKVTLTVDLFFMGLVFFRKGEAKQHFVVRY